MHAASWTVTGVIDLDGIAFGINNEGQARGKHSGLAGPLVPCLHLGGRRDDRP